jgi:hypothetical protein
LILGLWGFINAIWLFLWFMRRNSRIASNRGGKPLCFVCGHGLSENSERCPECGTPIDQFKQFSEVKSN